MAVIDDHGQVPGSDVLPGQDFGRQPPQDLTAEQSVLGGIVLSRTRSPTSSNGCAPGDFYRRHTSRCTGHHGALRHKILFISQSPQHSYRLTTCFTCST